MKKEIKMKPYRRSMIVWALGIIAAMSLTACVVHDHGHFAQVDVLDVHGYHHQGYYDDHHDWHGGYYDESHQFHDDPHDWHQ
jgi:hypothetical protein